MSTSRIQQATNHFRAQLKARQVHAEQILEAAYAEVLKVIEPQLSRLYDQIAAKQQAGEDIPLSWLYEERRLQAIKQLISGQIDQFAAFGKITTGQLQQQAIILGSQLAQTQLEATVPSGVTWSFGVPSIDAIIRLVGATQAGSPLADLFAGFGAEAAKSASDALISGVSLGWGPQRIASQVSQALDVPRWRALTVARTESVRAYKGAALENYRANSDVVGGWIWVCALLKSSCAACVAMHGTRHSLDEQLQDHPCGRCTMAPETKSWADILGPLGIDTSDIKETRLNLQSGSDWLSGQDEATQKAILGPKYNGWSNGDFSLEDMVGENRSQQWGKSIYERSLKDLVST